MNEEVKLHIDASIIRMRDRFEESLKDFRAAFEKMAEQIDNPNEHSNVGTLVNSILFDDYVLESFDVEKILSRFVKNYPGVHVYNSSGIVIKK